MTEQSNRILVAIWVVFCTSLSIQGSQWQSPLSGTSGNDRIMHEQNVPSVTLDSFGNWSPDTISLGESSTISISVKGSKDLPHVTTVTLSFGATVSDGTANFEITPADSHAGNTFSFSIGPGETKVVTARYRVKSFARAPRIHAMCDITVKGPAVTGGSPQTSAGELWIR